MGKTKHLLLLTLLLAILPEYGDAQEIPCAFLNVKKLSSDPVRIKHYRETDWQTVHQFAQLFPNDSVKIPDQAVVMLADSRPRWQELKGPKVLVIGAEDHPKSQFGQFFERLYLNLVVEKQRRRYAIDAVRGAEQLRIAWPDTVRVLQMPDRLHWLANEPWWSQYRVKLSFQRQVLLDTMVLGNSIQLNPGIFRRPKPGYYRYQVIAATSKYAQLNADSCVIYLPDPEISKKLRHQAATFKTASRRNYDDYMSLADFYLGEKLYLDLEQTLIGMIRQFPERLEPQLMLYAYYASFMPPEQTKVLLTQPREQR